jgi:phage shock protein C
MNGNFALDKSNAKLMGVCAGFANWTEVDPMLVRLCMILTSIFVAPVMILLYLIVGFVAPQGERV